MFEGNICEYIPNALNRVHSLRNEVWLHAYCIPEVLVWLILRLAMPNHGALLAKEKKLESEFRFAHTRLRQQAESIASHQAEWSSGGMDILVLLGFRSCMRELPVRIRIVEFCFCGEGIP